MDEVESLKKNFFRPPLYSRPRSTTFFFHTFFCLFFSLFFFSFSFFFSKNRHRIIYKMDTISCTSRYNRQVDITHI